MTATILAIVYLTFMQLFLMSFRGGFTLISQDCGLIPVTVRGRVQDKHRVPVQTAIIAVTNVGGAGLEAGDVAITIVSDKNGQFQQSNVNAFACDTLKLSVSAKGFITQTLEVSAYPEKEDDKEHRLAYQLVTLEKAP